jgi:hypothetical protein
MNPWGLLGAVAVTVLVSFEANGAPVCSTQAADGSECARIVQHYTSMSQGVAVHNIVVANACHRTLVVTFRKGDGTEVVADLPGDATQSNTCRDAQCHGYSGINVDCTASDQAAARPLSADPGATSPAAVPAVPDGPTASIPPPGQCAESRKVADGYCQETWDASSGRYLASGKIPGSIVNDYASQWFEMCAAFTKSLKKTCDQKNPKTLQLQRAFAAYGAESSRRFDEYLKAFDDAK